MTNTQKDLISRLLLKVDDKLADLHLATQMKDEEKQAVITEELSTIHATLRALGHYPSDLKVTREKVGV